MYKFVLSLQRDCMTDLNIDHVCVIKSNRPPTLDGVDNSFTYLLYHYYKPLHHTGT